MDLRHVALVVWLLSWLGVLAAYVASAQGDHIPACVPHFTGCTSVSAAGRYGAGFFIFKATMLPAAAFWAVYWVLSGHWLRSCGETVWWRSAVVGVGLVGALSFVLYTTFLGSEGDLYRVMRRYGTVLFFGCTFLAQLLLAYRTQAGLGDTRLVRIKFLLCFVALVEGLTLGALAYLVEDDDWLENLAEWHVATAMTFYPALTWMLWRNTGWTVGFSLPSRASSER